jgi:hypothetical protein
MIAVLQGSAVALLFCLFVLCFARRDWFARRLYWLRHKMIRWLDYQTTEQLAALMFGCCMFVMALSVWMGRMVSP